MGNRLLRQTICFHQWRLQHRLQLQNAGDSCKIKGSTASLPKQHLCGRLLPV